MAKKDKLKVERKPDNCNDKCKVAEKDVGGILTEFCEECMSILSYVKPDHVKEKKVGIDVRSDIEVEVRKDEGLRGKIARNKVYHEKCEVTLSRMPDRYVDYIMTSPPYNIGEGEFKKYKEYSDDLTQKQWLDWQVYLIEESLRVTKKHIFYNVQMLTDNKIALVTLREHFKNNFKEEFIWVKRAVAPASAPGVLNSQYEFIMVFSNLRPDVRVFPDAAFAKGELSNVIDVKRTRNRFTELNKATFPIDLPRFFVVNFGKKGDLWYDPFGGTGTTAVACKMEGRDYILSELSKDLAVSAIKRIDSVNELKLEL